MDRYPKRLIEVDLPIRRISEHARREKSIRHGHISTLHIWWARRPLAACRAVLCASLWPDPADELCPNEFRKTAKNLMINWSKNHLKLASNESSKRFVAISKDTSVLDDNIELRKALLDFIVDFANWDNSTIKEYLELSQSLTQFAHESLGGIQGTSPLVVDPFAGGGAIPLESLRVGADAFASDLNPIATLINKVVLELIPKYGQKLTMEIQRWGKWVNNNAEKELSSFYPKDSDGSIPVAYLWARTIKCEGPGCGVDVPLLGNLWLSKQTHNRAALYCKSDGPGHPINLYITHNPNNVKKGFTSGNSATCPACGYTTPVKRVRYQLSENNGGSSNSRLCAIVTIKPTIRGKHFREPTKEDEQLFKDVEQALLKLEIEKIGNLPVIPNEMCPPDGALGFRFQKYGIKYWRHLYTNRQLLALCVFTKLVYSKELYDQISNKSGKVIATSVQTLLALAIGRLNDRLCTLCRWRPDKNNVEAANGGQNKMPMLLDFAESNPFGGSSGDWIDHIGWITRVIDHISESGIKPADVQQGPAQVPLLPNDCASVIFTDPPYFDAFGYSDLSEFFHIWLRRVVPLNIIDLQSKNIPKREEAISIGKDLNDGRGMKDVLSYSSEMTKSFQSALQTAGQNSIAIVVFANKTTAGWEAILESLIASGWIATASWPIYTELANRQRALGSAALNSSVHIVCRPRKNSDSSLSAFNIGDWRDILSELPKRIHEWLPRLAEEGVVGADAIFACLGPALEIFSRYSSVEKASGEKVELKEYLEHVWAAVSREALSMIFEGADASGFEEDARLTAMWLWTLRTSTQNGAGIEEDDDGKITKLTGYSLEYDAARKIAQGLGAHLESLGHLVQTKGDTATLLAAGSRAKYLFGKDAEDAPKKKSKKKAKQLSLFEELEEESEDWFGEFKGQPGKTILDQLHQSMILFGAGRGEALKRFLVEEGVGKNALFWRLAQSLSALYPSGTEEKRWVDGVLARKKGLGL
jgi:adenine-specific DNA methylase